MLIYVAIVLNMLSCVLSRSINQAVAGVNNRSFVRCARGFRTSTSTPSDSDSVVTYEQLKSMLSSHNIQLFDVRNPDEFQAGRIPDSVNIPLGHLEESLKLSPEHFELIFEVKAPGKDDDNIVFHCQRGARSSKALVIARQLGFTRARHFKGGYSEWAANEGK